MTTTDGSTVRAPAPGGQARRGAGPGWRRWSWVGVLAGGLAAYLLVLHTLTTTKNINFFPSLILIGSITVPVAVLVYAWGADRHLPLSTGLVVVTAIVGGVVGTVTAGTLEYDSLRDLGGLPMTGVGIVEEASKLVVPVIILLLTRPRDPRPGVIIGVASGMGFATLETMGYGFQSLLSSRGDIAAVDDILLLRGLLSPAGHVAWTGLTVAALWRIPGAASRGRALMVFALSYVAAVVLHATWDGTQTMVLRVAVVIVSVAVLMTLVRRAHREPVPAT